MVRVIFWDRRADKFKPGSWFRGRIFVDRSGISPDGRHLIYFAKGGVAWAIPKTGGNWTAISRVPSLKAVALWGQEDTWAGGGYFLSNKTYWLGANDQTFLIRDHSALRRVARAEASPSATRSWISVGPWAEKTLRHGWILRRQNFGGPYELAQPEDGTLLRFSTWEWADWDRHRLVWTEAGCLKSAALGAHKLGDERILYDCSEHPMDLKKPGEPLAR